LEGHIVVSNPKIPLKDLFRDLQEKLASTLKATRRSFWHPVAKGSATEKDWLGVLEQLPSRYQIAQAFVVDADGNCSDYIDLVVYDRQYCPILFTHQGEHYIPAESVYAVFEVKQSLNKEHLEYASAKIASVRRLRRTSAPIQTAEGEWKPRQLFDVLGGFLATSADWTPPFGSPFDQTLSALPKDGQIDLGCVIEVGAFELDDGKTRTSTSETALVSFFLSLLQRLQKCGTVPAIDLAQYRSAIT
jgi:hypothetical protein